MKIVCVCVCVDRETAVLRGLAVCVCVCMSCHSEFSPRLTDRQTNAILASRFQTYFFTCTHSNVYRKPSVVQSWAWLESVTHNLSLEQDCKLRNSFQWKDEDSVCAAVQWAGELLNACFSDVRRRYRRAWLFSRPIFIAYSQSSCTLLCLLGQFDGLSNTCHNAYLCKCVFFRFLNCWADRKRWWMLPAPGLLSSVACFCWHFNAVVLTCLACDLFLKEAAAAHHRLCMSTSCKHSAEE